MHNRATCRHRIWLNITSVFTVLVLAGCSSAAIQPKTRYVGTPVQEPPRLDISTRDEAVAVTLDHVIVPEGPGTWVKGALWDEYVLTVQNLSAEPLTVEAIRLIDPRGVYIRTGVDPESLETATQELSQHYEDIGISVAIWAAPAVVTGAAVAAGSFGTAVAAAALAPVAVVAAPAYYFWRRHSKLEDKEQISREFERRQISYLALAPGAVGGGSQFFPIIPNPQSLVVDYRVGSERKTIELLLEALQGLHVEG